MKKRAPPAQPSLHRRSPIRSPKVEFVIACEGKATEPAYLRECIRHYGAGSVKLRILKETGVPLTLVKLAISEREALLEQYRRTPDQHSYSFVVWAIFDRDAHPHYDEAIALAKANNILLAVSNPCFELWPFLHFEDCASHTHRHDMQAALARVMPAYHHERTPIVDFESLVGEVGRAERRAQALQKAADANDAPYDNPTTSMSSLVRAVIKNGRKQPVSAWH
jgi:hypothetical protein